MREDRKSCFIITPIGVKGSDTFRKTEGLLQSVLEPVLESNGYNIEVAHRISESGSINNQIITRIEACDLVIANLTELNPNVFYELGLRHAIGKHVISIAENDTNLPFDVNDQRTIFFENDIAGVSELKSNLDKAVSSIDFSEEANNPFYDAMRVTHIKEKIRESKTEVEGESINEIILEEIGSLKQQVDNLNQYQLSKKELLKSNEDLYQEYIFRIRLGNKENVDEFIQSNDLQSLYTMLMDRYEIEIQTHYNEGSAVLESRLTTNHKGNMSVAIRQYRRFLDEKGIDYKVLRKK